MEDERRAKQREYYAKNRERKLEIQKDYREKNKDKINTTARDNWDKRREIHNAQRKARYELKLKLKVVS